VGGAPPAFGSRRPDRGHRCRGDRRTGVVIRARVWLSSPRPQSGRIQSKHVIRAHRGLGDRSTNEPTFLTGTPEIPSHKTITTPPAHRSAHPNPPSREHRIPWCLHRRDQDRTHPKPCSRPLAGTRGWLNPPRLRATRQAAGMLPTSSLLESRNGDLGWEEGDSATGTIGSVTGDHQRHSSAFLTQATGSHRGHLARWWPRRR
jgi:hypothetical protein